MFPQKIIIKIDDQNGYGTKIRNPKLDFTVFDESSNTFNETFAIKSFVGKHVYF